MMFMWPFTSAAQSSMSGLQKLRASHVKSFATFAGNNAQQAGANTAASPMTPMSSASQMPFAINYFA